MKKLFKVTALSLSFMMVTPAVFAGGVPVIDVTELPRHLEKIYEMQKQLKQAQQAYEAAIGNRNVGALFSNPTLAKYLPSEMKSVYQDYANKNWGGLADRVATLSNGEQLNGTQKQILEAVINRQTRSLYENRATFEKVMQEAGERYNQIARLMNTIDLSTDPKMAQDLQNRIAVEQAMLQLQQTQVELMGHLRQAEKEMIAEQERKRIAYKNDPANWSPRKLSPIVFNK